MARHRSPGARASGTPVRDVQLRDPVPADARSPRATPRGAGAADANRAPLGIDDDMPMPEMTQHTSGGTRGRIVIAAVAAGAFAAAGAGQLLSPTTSNDDSGSDQVNAAALKQSLPGGGQTTQAAHRTGMGGGTLGSPDVLLSARTGDARDEVRQMASNQRAISDVADQRAAAARAKAERERPKFVNPVPSGDYTSGFEGRWGEFHYGIDLAAEPDAPIHAAADGEIIEAGPASGFGLWVREKLDDGTVLVYGHMDDYSVDVGDRVKAGEEIARVGDRGHSTGYHCHFEVWEPSGKKIDPEPWLAEHDVKV